MKTPDEIKKALEYMSITNVAEKVEKFKQGLPYAYIEEVSADALAYIQQLEAHNAQQARCIENMTDMLNAAHDETVMLKAQVPKWISVEERLPERHGQMVMGLYNQRGASKSLLFPYVFTWYAYGGNGYVNGPHFSDEGVDGLKVHYWMPLPEPPKEDV